jgi:hypothetical protein
MYLGNSIAQGAVGLVKSAPKIPPASALTNAPAGDEDIAEIVVTAKRIPWWQWMLGGATAVILVNQFRK